MDLAQQLKKYTPFNEQEEKDRDLILNLLQTYPDIYTRENRTAHMTASAWVVSKDRKKVLMAYHNLYDSWAWLGGHCDGDRDLLHVALKEVREESGLAQVEPADGEIFSLEVLTVDGHEKRGEYVSSHLHLNVTYLLEADSSQPLASKPDENKAVAWFEPDEVYIRSTEPWFVERIYKKLNAKLAEFIEKENQRKK
jgi:ADP-ribose pyrophosphatase YjhB (NUDIX family)